MKEQGVNQKIQIKQKTNRLRVVFSRRKKMVAQAHTRDSQTWAFPSATRRSFRLDPIDVVDGFLYLQGDDQPEGVISKIHTVILQ